MTKRRWEAILLGLQIAIVAVTVAGIVALITWAWTAH